MKKLYFRYASSKESQCYEAVSLCHLLSQAQKLKKHFSKSENSDTGEAILPEFGSERFDWLPTMICLTCYKDIAVWKQNPRY